MDISPDVPDTTEEEEDSQTQHRQRCSPQRGVQNLAFSSYRGYLQSRAPESAPRCTPTPDIDPPRPSVGARWDMIKREMLPFLKGRLPHKVLLKSALKIDGAGPRPDRPDHIRWEIVSEDNAHVKSSSLWMSCAFWEVIAFPLRPAITSPNYYDCLNPSFLLSPLPCLDALVDVHLLFDLVMNVRPADDPAGPRGRIVSKTLLRVQHLIQVLYITCPQWIGAMYSPSLGLWGWQLCAIPRFVHALFQVQRNKQFLNKDMIDPEKLLQERGTPSEMAKFGATLFLVLHYTGCILFASARAQNFDLTTWVGIYATGFPLYDVDKAPDFERYIFMLHKGADAMTLAGVNFTPPQNSLEALLYCLSMVGQIFMVAYILGTLFHSLVIKDAGMETHKENLAELTKFSQQCRLPEELHTELVNHFKFQYSKQNSFLSNDPS
ncbi:hypothetical protein CYMTET_25465, partial [Cymbomonas tetramitiformis]